MNNFMKLGIGLSLALGFSISASAAEDTFKAGGCNACHAVDKKTVGPALQDIAKKYKGQADAADKLIKKVRTGGSGNWGAIPMPPNNAEKISDANLKATIEWILKQ